MHLNDKTLAVVGLGYVGLPLAVEFGKIRPVIGFDINQQRIDDLSSGVDRTLEISANELRNAKHLTFTSDTEYLKSANIFIVTVPTPVDRANRPDLRSLVKASEMVGKVLKVGDLVIYESTVYPGCTEEDCVPILEQFSCLKLNQEFF